MTLIGGIEKNETTCVVFYVKLDYTMGSAYILLRNIRGG